MSITEAYYLRSTYRLPDTLEQELEKFAERTHLFLVGEMPATEYRAFRVPQGVYEQRQEGAFLLRCRFPAGAVFPHQMRMLAEVSGRRGNGILQVTSRQGVQLHRVPLNCIVPALRQLHAAGICTKGCGGNTVRNITGCADAGVCPYELFDVTPHTAALTEFLLRDPLSFQLPRKYKIAFSGCDRDCAGAAVNDLGFVAARQGAINGFTVYAGGGLGTHNQVGELLEDFVTPEEIFVVAEAVKRVFDRYGDRKNKQRARLRFLVKRIGFEEFRGLYREELAALQTAPPGRPGIGEPATAPPERFPGDLVMREGFGKWREANVRCQKQAGYYVVDIPLPFGEIAAARMAALADVVEVHGEGMLRMTQSQNVCLRWVGEAELPALHAKLAGIGLTSSLPPVLRNLVTCAGAATCQLGLCRAKELAQAVSRELERSGLDLARLGEVKLHISGCPCACGRHPVGHVGLYGAARRAGARLAPYYVFQLGGRVGAGRTRLAEGSAALPAKNVPAFLKELFAAFLSSNGHADFNAFLEAGGCETAQEIALKYSDIADFEEDKNPYFDWGAGELFSLAGRGAGECGAGVFDLIELDLATAVEALAEGKCFAATVHAARALLVTRGQEPTSVLESLDLFRKLFLAEGLVAPRFADLIDDAVRCGSLANPETEFRGRAEEARALVAEVKALYENMDASLRFTAASQREAQHEPPLSPEETAATSGPDPQAFPPAPNREQDFRGVRCPLNYVKTKLTLEQMQPGEVLAVRLDEEGARNVSASVSDDGQEVLAVEKEGQHWRVVIRKAR